ncbi:MAG: hypothetical protein HQ483_03560 [Rhodospirillales bacterium]|nr:hypothetical protein [Rhodospirillales bacterium]
MIFSKYPSLLLLGLGLFLACALPQQTRAAEFAGRVTVLHGDTLRLGDTRIHLQGTVSPPSGAVCTDAQARQWPCGDSAAEWMAAAIGDQPVSCHGSAFNPAGQLRAMCYVGTRNLNGAIVGAGWAVAEGRYGRWHESLQAKARDAGFGLWADGTAKHWRWDW